MSNNATNNSEHLLGCTHTEISLGRILEVYTTCIFWQVFIINFHLNLRLNTNVKVIESILLRVESEILHAKFYHNLNMKMFSDHI